MDITGKFIKLLPTQEGDSSRGHWVRGGFVIETEDRYPQKIAFSLFGEDKVRMVQQLQLGAKLQVQFSPESREYQDRWYTELRAYNIATITVNNMASAGGYMPSATAQAAVQQPATVVNAVAMPEENDDLPF